MQTPNLSLKVEVPSATTGVPNTYVNGNFNDQFFGGMTDSNGELRVFIDTSTATTCSTNCFLRIYPWNNANYTEKTHSTVGLTVGGPTTSFKVGSVNSTVTIRIPTNGGVGLPNAWGWAMVEELNETGTVTASDGYGTNQLGQIGLDLTENSRYRITAYPSGDYFDRYSPKVYEISAFEVATMNKIDITFDSPNITLIVLDKSKVGNAWGWYEVKKKSEPGTEFVYYSDGYLNSWGRAAIKLINGTYRIKFNPGKASGIAKEVEFTVTDGHAVVAGTTNITFVNDVGTVELDLGNITGIVRGANGSVAASHANPTTVFLSKMAYDGRDIKIYVGLGNGTSTSVPLWFGSSTVGATGGMNTAATKIWINNNYATRAVGTLYASIGAA
jgi:hypothetical protein